MKFSYPDIAINKPIPAPLENEYPVRAWGVEEYGGSFKQLTIYRHEVGDYDVKFQMKFCGICHSDVHNVLNEMSRTRGGLPHHTYFTSLILRSLFQISSLR